MADHLSGLIDGLDKRVDAPVDAKGAGDLKKIGPTLVEQMADLQDELARLEAGLTWAMVLEQVITLRCAALLLTVHLFGLTTMRYIADCPQRESPITDCTQPLSLGSLADLWGAARLGRGPAAFFTGWHVAQAGHHPAP